MVELGARFVDELLALLDGLVDLVERRLHGVRRVHVLEHDLLDVDADPVGVAELLQDFVGLGGYAGAAGRNDFVHAVVPHDLAHRRFGHVAKAQLRRAHIEQKCARVLDPVLHDPLDDGNVQIAREHQGFVLEAPVDILRPDPGLGGAEAELLLELALDRHLDHGVDERDEKVKPRSGVRREAPESEHDAPLIRVDLVDRAESGHRNNETDKDRDRVLRYELGYVDLRHSGRVKIKRALTTTSKRHV